MNINSMNLLLFDVISSIGSKIFSFACAFYILQHTHNSVLYTVYLTFIVISTIISQPLFGVWIDKFNNKNIVFYAQIINIIFLSLFILVYDYYFYYLILLGIVLNLTDGIISIIINANIKNISEEDMERFVSIRQMYMVAIGFLAPILGGILLGVFKIEYLAMFNIITEFLAIISFIFIKINRIIEVEHSSFKKNISVGFLYLIKNKTLLNFMGVSLVLNFLVNSVVIGIPVTAIQVKKLSTEQLGIIEAGSTLGMFLMSLALSIYPLKNKLKGPFQVSIIFQFLAVFLLSITLLLNLEMTFSFVLFIIVYFIIGLALPLLNVPYSIYMQNSIEESYKGRVFSLNQSIVQSITPLSYLLFGLILNYSQATVYFLVSLLIGVVLIYFSVAVKKEKINP